MARPSRAWRNSPPANLQDKIAYFESVTECGIQACYWPAEQASHNLLRAAVITYRTCHVQTIIKQKMFETRLSSAEDELVFLRTDMAA
jgi:hypothetical protein